MADNISLIKKVFAENGLDKLLNADRLEKLNGLIDNMLETNEKFNLTSITDPEEIILKHIADSATIIKYIPEKAKLIDVGTGGGFPSLPIAILRDDVIVYALDSTAKKLAYIDETAKKLGLSNIKTIVGRAEEHGKTVNYRQRFDVATARAVASLNVLCELCIPFVKVGGSFISMKGSNAQEEVDSAKSAVIQLGGSKFVDEQFSLAYNGSEFDRHILISKKVKPTPDSFPRAYSRISKKPL